MGFSAGISKTPETEVAKLKIYLTHCSAKKNDSLKNTGAKVPPEVLYTATPIRRFMERCQNKNVRWAIFSDLYGVWFPERNDEWYEKDPDDVTDEEFSSLVQDFDTKLHDYTEIYFYYNPGRFHRFYKKLLQRSSLKNRVVMISHLSDIA